MGLLCEMVCVTYYVTIVQLIDFFNCSVELDCLGPMLCEIVVALTTFLNKFPDIVSDIFKYLIVEHK